MFYKNKLLTTFLIFLKNQTTNQIRKQIRNTQHEVMLHGYLGDNKNM